MEKKITIKNIPAGYQSFISNGRHSLVGDEPQTSKGTDLGFSPEDFVLSSLAMCKVATVRYIARKNNWIIRDVDGELTMNVTRGEGGKLSTHITVAIKIEGDITEEQKAELLKQADACYIHRMINGEWTIEPSKSFT
jgi:putative redox protein